jgi:hypothetical protein
LTNLGSPPDDIPRDLYDCTAAGLVTHFVNHLQHGTSSSTTVEWLTENGYDAAPVYADDDPIGFICFVEKVLLGLNRWFREDEAEEQVLPWKSDSSTPFKSVSS